MFLKRNRKDTIAKSKTIVGKDRETDENTPDRLADMDAASAPVQETKAEGQEASVEQPSDPVLNLTERKDYRNITHPEYKKYLFQKEFTCPHCKRKFTGMQIFYSKLPAVSTQLGELCSNLHITYKDFEIEWYEIITCPNCFFSSFNNYFTDPKPLRRERYGEQLSGLSATLSLDFEAERTLDFVLKQHDLALVCAPGLKDSKQITARLWMNLYWLYREAKDETMALMARGKATEAYQQVYTHCNLNPTQEQRVCLELTFLLYQAGELAQAREWAYKARTNRMGKTAYSNLAQRFIEDIRTEMPEKE